MIASYPIVFETEESGAVSAYVPDMPVYATADSPGATFLAEQGARIEVWNQQNKRGWTPLTIAEGVQRGRELVRTASWRVNGVGPTAALPSS